MPDNNISKAQPSKAKGLGGVLTIRSKNAALLYMYRLKHLCNSSSLCKNMEADIFEKLLSYFGPW